MISSAILQAFPGAFIRILGCLIILPFAHSISNIGKMFVFSFGLTLFFVTGNVQAAEYSSINILTEFLIGIVISLPIALTVDAVRSLGELFDSQRGLSFASSYDPNVNVQASVSSHLTSNYCITALIGAGILENLLFTIKKSFALIPLYSMNVAEMSDIAVNVIYFISFVCGAMFQSFLLCALIFMLVDVGSLFLSKALNQSAFHQEIFLVKSLLGLLLVVCVLKLNPGPAISTMASPNIKMLISTP